MVTVTGQAWLRQVTIFDGSGAALSRPAKWSVWARKCPGIRKAGAQCQQVGRGAELDRSCMSSELAGDSVACWLEESPMVSVLVLFMDVTPCSHDLKVQRFI